MKAAVLHGKNDIRYDDVNIPQIGRGEVLVRVKSTGICGSDLPRVLGDAAHYYPIVLGHEFSGVVETVDDDVEGLKVGQLVAGAPLVPCHRCEDCVQGRFAQCAYYTFIGSRVFGSWAEFIAIPARNAVPLPSGVSADEGAFLEPISVALHGLFLMGLCGGYDVAVVGVGTIGLLALQCARILGARQIFAFDVADDKLEIAREYGADVCLNTSDPGFKEELCDRTGGRGFQYVVETAGVEFTEKLSLEIAGNHGHVMYIGTPSKPITLAVREFEQINRKELHVRGSWMSYAAPFPGRSWTLAGEYLQRGLIRCDRLIDRVIPLADVRDAFADFAAPGRVQGKVLLNP